MYVNYTKHDNKVVKTETTIIDTYKYRDDTQDEAVTDIANHIHNFDSGTIVFAVSKKNGSITQIGVQNSHQKVYN
jgi:hypothetical protein